MNLQNVKNILELLTEFETLVADYYLACAEKWEEGREMWASIHKDEKKHAAYIKVISIMIDRQPEDFSVGGKFKEFAIEVAVLAAMDRLRKKIDEVKSLKISMKDAIIFSGSIELSLLEHIVSDVIETSNPKYRKMIDSILSDTERHRDTFDTLRRSGSPILKS
jgi:rubrerythrin